MELALYLFGVLNFMDQSFSHVIARTEISDQLGNFNLVGKPSLESIAAAYLYILGKSAICTPCGVTYRRAS